MITFLLLLLLNYLLGCSILAIIDKDGRLLEWVVRGEKLFGLFGSLFYFTVVSFWFIIVYIYWRKS